MREAGFTLIELIAVMVLISALLVFSPPVPRLVMEETSYLSRSATRATRWSMAVMGDQVVTRSRSMSCRMRSGSKRPSYITISRPFARNETDVA